MQEEPVDNVSSLKTLALKPTPRIHQEQSQEPSSGGGGYNEAYEISPIKPTNCVYGGELTLKDTKVTNFSPKRSALQHQSRSALDRQEVQLKKQQHINPMYFNKINNVTDISAINKSKMQNDSSLDIQKLSVEAFVGSSSLFKMNHK